MGTVRETQLKTHWERMSKYGNHDSQMHRKADILLPKYGEFKMDPMSKTIPRWTCQSPLGDLLFHVIRDPESQRHDGEGWVEPSVGNVQAAVRDVQVLNVVQLSIFIGN